MHINHVVSFLNSWQTAHLEFLPQLQDVRAALNTYRDTFLAPSAPATSRFPYEPWEAALTPLGWQTNNRVTYANTIRTGFASLGPIKGGVSATPSTNIDALGRWLFQRGNLAVRLGVVRLPILLLPTSEYARRLSNRFMARVPFEHVKKQLDALTPLSHTSPFLILGYSDIPESTEPQVYELAPYFSEKERLFERSIEFPREYHQAGIGILNFFGTYLTERYPQADAVVRIEQEGLKVRLIIQGKDGAKEVVEKALQEYELIVSQKVPPETVVDNPRLVLELRQELRIAQVRIEGQKDILALQESRIDQLLNIIGAGLSKPTPVTIDFKPAIAINNTQANQIISGAIETLDELKDLLPASSAAQISVDDLERSLEAIELETSPAKIKGSGVLEKFRAFLDKAHDSSSDFKGVVEATEQGLETLQKLAGKYNLIAEWCGLPQVPSIFTK
jgi:hypothetical protein